MSAVRVRHRPPAFAPSALRLASRPDSDGVFWESSPGDEIVGGRDGRRRGAKEVPEPGRSLHRLFELFGGAEGDLLAGLDLDGLAGRGIAAHASGALAHHKNAEPADADAVALLEMLGHQ